MKIKNDLSLFNIIFLVVVVLMFISCAIGMFFVGGYTSKTIPLIIAAMAASSVTSGIHYNFFMKKKETTERTIDIENKAKAKAFDVMEIIFGILIIVFVLLKANLLIIALVVVAYLLIRIVYMVHFSKFHKRM